MESGSLSLPEPSGSHRAVMGLLSLCIIIHSFHSLLYNLCGRCAVIKKNPQTNHAHRQSWSKSDLHLQNVLNDVLPNCGTHLFDWSFWNAFVWLVLLLERICLIGPSFVCVNTTGTAWSVEVCTWKCGAFGKLLCTYKRCWTWRPRASIQAWTHMILFTNTFCKYTC
jgi:hypothetical protein